MRTHLIFKSMALIVSLSASQAFAGNPASTMTPDWQSVFGIQIAKDDYVSCAQRAKEKKEYCLTEMGYSKEKCAAEYEQNLKQCEKIRS